MVNDQEDQAEGFAVIPASALEHHRRLALQAFAAQSPFVAWLQSREKGQETMRTKKLSPQQRGAITRAAKRAKLTADIQRKLKERNEELERLVSRNIADGSVGGDLRASVQQHVPYTEHQATISMGEKFDPPKLQGGVKHDNNKLRYDLIPPELMAYAAMAYTRGAVKYTAHNWEEGLAWSRVYGGLQRHLNDWWSGNHLDEDGQPNLAGAAACLGMLIAYEARKAYGVQGGVDDRWHHNARHIQQQMTRTAGDVIIADQARRAPKRD